MDLFFAICEGIGLALAAIVLVIALAALVFNKPLGILRRAARRMGTPDNPNPPARPLGLILLIFAAFIAAGAIVFPPTGLVTLFTFLRIFILRRSREESKHAGLRVLK